MMGVASSLLFGASATDVVSAKEEDVPDQLKTDIEVPKISIQLQRIGQIMKTINT